MKNLKIISTILLSSILLGATNITNAYTYKNNNSSLIQNFKDYKEKQYLKQKYREMEKMNTEELQNIISDAKKIIAYNNYSTRSISGFLDEYRRQTLKGAWLAAAQIAKRIGYPLAAELVEYSLLGYDYREFDGKFANEIRKLDLYKKTMLKNKNGHSKFTRDIHSDLFFAIHEFKYDTIDYFGMIRVTDTFNFEESNGRFGFLIGKINDFAFLMQNMDVLNSIEVEIDIPIW